MSKKKKKADMSKEEESWIKIRRWLSSPKPKKRKLACVVLSRKTNLHKILYS